MSANPLPKFLPPRRRADICSRPRLLGELDRVLDHDGVLLTAPAGYGKSTLVLDWLDQAGLPAAWLRLDELDRDPVLFARDLTTAVRTRFPEALSSLQQRLNEGSVAGAAALLGGELASAVQAEIDDLFVLVVDDLHLLDGADDACRVLDRLLQFAPSNVRYCLLSRTRPTLPSLPRVLEEQRLQLIEHFDLAFRDDEARDLLAKVGIPDSAQTPLIERCGGWAAALVILGRHHERSGGAISPPLFREFLEAEVLAGLSENQRALLDATCVVRDFDVELAIALSGDADAAAVLNGLESRLHLIARVGDVHWTMHDLLRSHIAEGLALRDPQRYRRLLGRAAAELSGRGDRRAAVELAIRAQDWPSVVAELLDQWGDLYRRGEWQLLAQWFDAVPWDFVGPSPDLALMRARLATKLLQPQESLERLQRIEPDGLEPHDRVRWHLYRATALRQLQRLRDALAAYTSARATALETGVDDPLLAAELDLEEGVALGMNGRLAEARARLADAAAAFTALNETFHAAEAFQNLGTTCFQQGWLADAMNAFVDAHRRWLVLADPRAQLGTMNNIATTQHMLGELVTAQDAFEQLQQKAETLGDARRIAYAQLGLAAVYSDQGNFEAAERLFSEVLGRVRDLDEPTLAPAATLGLARTLLDRGDYDRATTLLNYGLAMVERAEAVDFQARYRTVLASAALAQHRVEAAVDLLERARADTESTGNQRQRVLVDLYTAQACLAQRRRSEALKHLENVAEVVERLGYDHFLLVEARRVPAVITFAASRRETKDYFRSVEARLAPPSVSTISEEPGEYAVVDVRAEAFGHPRVMYAGHRVADSEWRSERSKELFFLLLHRGKAMSKEQICAELWPDLEPLKVNSTFHTTLHRLRRAVHPDIVQTTADGYAVNTSMQIWYDAREFDELLSNSEVSKAGEDASRLRDAVELYRGPFAETFYSDWATEVRERYESRYVSALLSLAEHALAGAPEEAVTLCERIIETDPLSEEAVRLQMLALGRTGRIDAAARVYRDLRSAMTLELGQPPSGETNALYEKVLSGEILGS